MPGALPGLQDLPRPWARFCLGAASFARDELGCGFTEKHCLVACSGGADSTALLLLAALLCRRDGGRVTAAHLDHGLRPESAGDAAFVAEFCAHLDIPLIAVSEDVAARAASSRRGLEEAGREARYAFLERARRECGAELVLVAHQLNDLAEDQLLRLARGTGWPALGGMAGFDAERRLLRPLLLSPKARLLAFLDALGQTWRQDASNLLPLAARNRVRLHLLPLLERENPAYLDAAARLWRQANIDAAHWDAELRRVLGLLPAQVPGGAFLLPRDILEGCCAPLRLRLYKAGLDALGPGQALADSLFLLDALWRGGASGKAVGFPGDKRARITKPGVRLEVIDRKKECG